MFLLENNIDGAVADMTNRENKIKTGGKPPKGKQACVHWWQKKGNHCLLCAWQE